LPSIDTFRINHTSARLGIPISAVVKKKYAYPHVSTNTPDHPAIDFGNKNISELNSAYCVAEY